MKLMDFIVADAIVALRRERPRWGPKQLKAVLAQRQPAQARPAGGASPRRPPRPRHPSCGRSCRWA